MTALEKFRETCPEDVGYSIVDSDCPDMLGLLPRGDCRGEDGLCLLKSCSLCWGQTIPEGWKVPDVREEDSIEGKFTTATPVIKDSGDRTEFATGAVRDMREGKGRCDLMPLGVAASLLGDPVLLHIHDYQKNDDVRELYYALSCFSEFAYEDICTMLLEVAKHFEEGAKKYGESNWKRGIPTWCYIDSAVRHYLKYLRGDKDEPHDRAFVWNLMCCIWTIQNEPEMKEAES